MDHAGLAGPGPPLRLVPLVEEPPRAASRNQSFALYHLSKLVVQSDMVTALARIQVTQTPVVERALEIAARRWPGIPKSEQLTRMLEIATATVEGENAERLARRKAALRELRGLIEYPPNYLVELRAGDRE